MGVLVSLADQRRRRDDGGEAGGLCIGLVVIQRIVIAERQGKIPDRGAAQILRRGVTDLASDPGANFVGKKIRRGASKMELAR